MADAPETSSVAGPASAIVASGPAVTVKFLAALVFVPVIAAVSRAVEWHQAAVACGPERAPAGDPIGEWLSGGRSGKRAPTADDE